MGVNNSNMGSASMHMNAHSMLLSLDHSGGSGSNRASAGSANGRYMRYEWGVDIVTFHRINNTTY